MIFLYSKLDVQNKGEGLGNLQDFVEEPIVTWNASGYLEVEFKYFLYGDLAEHMIPDAKLKTRIHSNDEVHHLFTIYEVEPDYIENTVQVRAEMTLLHELKDRVVPAGTMRGTANEMIMFVKNKMDRDYPFVITGNTDKTVFIEHDNISAYELIFGEDGILKRTGAEIGFTDRGIRLSNRIGTIHRDELRESDFVSNLTVNESQGEDFVTRIIPFTTAMFDRPIRDGERYNRETIETPTYGTPVISPNIANKMYKVRTKFVEYRNEPTEVPKYYNYETERGTETLEMSEYIYEDVTALNHDASTFFEDNTGIDEPTTTITIETMGLAKGYYTYLRYLNRYDIVTIYVEPKPHLTNSSETYVVQVNETVYEPLSDNLVSIGFTNESTSLENAYRNVNEGRISDQQLQAELQKERLRDLEDRLVNYVYNHDGFRLEFGNVLPPPDEYREGDLYYLETGEGIDIYQLVNGAWEFLVGQSTREIIEGKIEEIEKQAEELTKDIEASDQKATEAKEEAGLAKSAVDAFGIITQETADKMVDVEQTVATAESNASDALAEASEAKTQAGQAVTNAQTAMDNAQTAQTDAQTAIDNAGLAQTDAQTAMDNAQSALTTAGNADSKAGQAIAKADAMPTTITDIIADKNLVNGSYVDTKVDNATGAWSQELIRVEGVVNGLEIGGRNLLPKTLYVGDGSTLGLYRTMETNGEITLDGIPSRNLDLNIANNVSIPLKKGQAYTFSITHLSGNISKKESMLLSFRSDDDSYENGNYISLELRDNEITFVPEHDGLIYRIRVFGLEGVQYDNFTFHMQLEKGTIRSDWTPAPEDLYTQEEFKIFNAQYTQDVEGVTGRLTTVENTKLDDSTFQTFKQAEYQVTAGKVASTMTRVDTAEDKITTQGTAISQQATAIASKADKTVVDTLSGTVSNQGTLITQNATAIESKAESSLVNTIKGTVDTHTTEISQNATAITSKAEQEEVDTVKGTVETHTTTLSQHATSIGSKAEKSVVDTLSSKVTTHETTLTQHADSIVSKAEQEEVDTVKGTVETHTTTLSQHATSIASKADKSVVDTLSGTVSTHGTTLTQHADSIASKAEQEEVDTVKGTVSTHTSTLEQQADAISARLTESQVDNLVGGKGYSTVSYVDNQMSTTAEAIRTEMTVVEGKIPTEIGGRNYLKNSYNFTTEGNDASGIVRSMTEEGLLKVVVSSGNGNYSANWGMGGSRGLITENIEAGEIVTFSMEVRSENSTQKPTFYFGAGMGYLPMEGSVGSEWSRIYVSRPWTATSWVPHVGFSGVSGTFEFRKGKLEKGNIATDWTPAPEDMLKQNDFNIFKGEYEQSAKGWSAKLLQIEEADYASKSWSNQTFATPQSVTTQLQSYAKTTDLNGLVTETALENKSYTTSSEVNTLLTSYAKTTDLNGMVTETTLANKNFATASSVTTQLQSYAKTTDLNGLATESYVGSQMSATADTIRSEVTAVEGKIPTQIGGRNLVKRSDFGNIVLSGVSGVAVLDEDYQNGLKAVGGNNQRNNYIEFPDVLSGNGWYTVSFLARGIQGGSIRMSVIIGDSPALTDGRIGNSSNEYTYHTYSYKVENYNSETNNSIKIAELDFAHYRIDNIKLEKGDIATDWTPSPEDMATSQQVSEIKQTADSIQTLVGTTNDSVARAVMTSNLWETEVSKVIDSELEQEYETVEGDVPFYEYTTPRSLLQGDRSMTIYLPIGADGIVDGKQVIVDVTYEVSEGGQGNHAAYIQYGDIESGEALMYSSSNTVTFVIYVPPGTRNGTIMDFHTNIVDSGNYTWATITNITVSTVEEIEVPINGSNTGAISSKITQLYDMINLSVLGKEGALSRIAMGEEGIQIDGKLLHITAKTYIDNAVIKSAMIDTLDAGKITTGELNASLIKVVNLDANSITGNEANFIQALFSGTTSTLQITGSGVNILDNSGKSSTFLDSSGIEFSREGINLGKLQYVTNTADSGDLYGMHGFSMRPNRNSYFGISYFPSITATESIRRFAVSGRTGNVYISGLIKPSEQHIYGLDITWGTITNIGTNVRIYNHDRTGGIQINNGDLSYLSSGGWRSLNGWLK